MKANLSPRVSGSVKSPFPGADPHFDGNRGNEVAFYFMMSLVVLGVLYFIVLIFML